MTEASDKTAEGRPKRTRIELLVRAFLRPGYEAVMAEQAFVIYQMVVQAAGATPRPIPLRRYTHDLDAIAQAIGPATRLVFLANPNNPTGTRFTADQSTVTCLRSVLMKPEHAEWLPRLWQILEEASA